jgi:hypothetical protein
VTTFLGTTVQIDWVEPYTQGSPVTGYRVYLLESDGVAYSLELNDCDAGEVIISDAKQCTVLVSTLKDAPYSLDWGTSIFAKVVAYNIYGDSEISEAGNGAIIITYADAPLDLIETISARTSSSITFTWSEGLLNGGSTVTDYRVSYENSGVYEILASNLVLKTYTAVGLNYGETYKFKVEAQNGFGYSDYSVEAAILCATHPEKPDAPITTVINDEVVFDWVAPVDNGMPITGYNV